MPRARPRTGSSAGVEVDGLEVEVASAAVVDAGESADSWECCDDAVSHGVDEGQVRPVVVAGVVEGVTAEVVGRFDRRPRGWNFSGVGLWRAGPNWGGLEQDPDAEVPEAGEAEGDPLVVPSERINSR